jgi:hypothetical protein
MRVATRAAVFAYENLAVLCLALIFVLISVYVHDNQSQRHKNVTAICSAFEAYTNALVGSSVPAVSPDKRAESQRRIDAFERDLETRLKPLDCDLHLIPAR